MRLISRFGAAALAVGAFIAPASAQIQVFGGVDQERTASTVVMFDGTNPGVMGGASVSFSPPKWKEEYNNFDAMLEQHKIKGHNVRLGKNWWTTLDTTIALELGGTKVEPGAYHLGLHCDKDGKFHLLLLDAKQSTKNGWVPFGNADAWKAEYRIPLEFKKDALETSKEKMEIELTSDPKDKTTGAFAVRWGKHELSAPVKFLVPAPKAGKGAENASGDKVEPAKK